MATFAAFVEPGTFVQIRNQINPPTSTPAFVTSLIGTTSIDKPVSKVLARDATIAGAETIRRDTLDTTVTFVTTVIDEVGVQHIKGSDAANNGDWTDTTLTGTTYVEWAAVLTRASLNIPGIELLQFSGATTIPVIADVPISSIDGTQTLNWTLTGTTLDWGGGATVNISAAVNGDVVELTDAAGGDIRLRITDAVTLLANADASDVITVTTGGPTLTTNFTVNYRKNKTAADLTPQLFDNLDALQAFHGPLVSTSISDRISMGAVPYFDQGGAVFAAPVRAKTIDGVTFDPTGFDIENVSPAIADAAWAGAVTEALVNLENIAEVSNVVPLTPTEKSTTNGDFRPGVFTAVIAHINKMNQLTEQKPRIAILGARANTTSEFTFGESAKFAKNENIVYMSPATATLTTSGFSFLVNGSTIAAGLAGRLSDPSLNAGEPVSGKSFQVFDSITDPFTRLQKNRIGERDGVTVIEIQDGTPTIRHFLTTDPTSPLTAEGKVSVIKIDISRTVKKTLNATVLNRRLLNGTTIATVRSILGLVLEQKILDQIINEFRIKKIAINDVDPRQLDVQVEVRPVFDLNFILVQAVFVQQ